jgi:hypothetical protein
MDRKRTFIVYFTTTGRGTAEIEAESLEEAQSIANAYEFDGQQNEWEYDEIRTVKEYK